MFQLCGDHKSPAVLPNCSKNQTSIVSSQKKVKKKNIDTTQVHTNWATYVASTCYCMFESNVLSSGAASRTRRTLHPSSRPALLQRGTPNSTVQHFREPMNWHLMHSKQRRLHARDAKNYAASRVVSAQIKVSIKRSCCCDHITACVTCCTPVFCP